MFGEIDSSNEEDVKKPVKKHKVSGKGKAAKKKKKGGKKHSAKKKFQAKG